MKRINVGEGMIVTENEEVYEIYITDIQEDEFTMTIKTKHQERIGELLDYLTFSRENGVLKIKGKNGRGYYVETEENRKKLRVGDYIGGNYILSRFVKLGEKYTRLLVEDLVVEDKLYDTVDELKKSIDGGYFYLVEDDFEFEKGRYLVYSPESEDFEIWVEHDGSKYRILKTKENRYFDDEGFYTLKEVESFLRERFSLIKKLRYSIYE